MDKRILWALGAAGAYVLLMSKGDFKDLNKVLKEHGMLAVIIGGAAYLLVGQAPANGANNGQVDEFADLPPQVQEQLIAEQQQQANAQQAQQNLSGYMKAQHQPIAGFDSRYRALGV